MRSPPTSIAGNKLLAANYSWRKQVAFYHLVCFRNLHVDTTRRRQNLKVDEVHNTTYIYIYARIKREIAFIQS